MTGTLDRIEARARLSGTTMWSTDKPGYVPEPQYVALIETYETMARDVLALVEVAKAAQEVVTTLREHAPEWLLDDEWPQVPALAAALARLEDNQ